MTTIEPTQLSEFPPRQAVGLTGTAIAEFTQLWSRPQEGSFLPLTFIVPWIPLRETDDLAGYVVQMAGTAEDLDAGLETAGIEHLLQDDQPNEW